MQRVVVTGLGIVSPIGVGTDEVTASLKAGRSGITANEDMVEHGFRSQIAGAVDIDLKEHVDKRALRFMGPGQAMPTCPWNRRSPTRGLRKATS